MSNKLKEMVFNLPLTFVGGEQEKTKVPFDDIITSSDKSFIKTVTDDERDEKFIYAYTDSGISENGRNWTPAHMKSMATQVIDKMPVGYLGHIKPSDYGYEFPEPQIVWFGSYVETLTTDTDRLWIKGYLLPTAEKLETWIKTKAVDSISVYGKISFKMKGEVMEIIDIDLKSIDISRKLGEGLNSGIVGLFGEMEVSYEDVRTSLEKNLRKEVRDDPSKWGFTKPTNNFNEDIMPYVYVWTKKVYVDDTKAVVSIECYGSCKIFETSYELDKDDGTVTITSAEEVVENTTYVKKKSGISKPELDISGEMSKKEETLMPNETITLASIKANKEIYAELKKEIATEMASEKNQEVMFAKAGEMDKIMSIVGEQSDMVSAIERMAKFNSKFVGEMSAIFGGESEELTPEVIVEKAKESVETVKAVKNLVKVEDDSEIVDAVAEVVEVIDAAAVKEAITEVDTKFNELIATITDETLAEFVRDDFADVVGLSPDDIEGDVETWKATSIKEIEDSFKIVVDKYEKRLAKAYGKGKAVGEMNAFEDLGTNVGSVKSAETDEDPDIAEAKRLGYGN